MRITLSILATKRRLFAPRVKQQIVCGYSEPDRRDIRLPATGFSFPNEVVPKVLRTKKFHPGAFVISDSRSDRNAGKGCRFV